MTLGKARSAERGRGTGRTRGGSMATIVEEMVLLDCLQGGIRIDSETSNCDAGT